MEQVIWRPSRKFGGEKSALHWWRNSYQSDIPPRGYVWIVHGMGEHAARYSELAQYLNQFGFDCLGPDLPGNGLSASEGGQNEIPSIDQAVDENIESLKYWFEEGPLSKRDLKSKPWYIVAHSLGALIAMSWILRGNVGLGNLKFAQRAFLSAPPLGVKLPVPAWKHLAAQVLSNVVPNLKMSNGIDCEDLSYDVGNVAHARNDKMMRGKTSPKQYLSMLKLSKEVFDSAANFEIPVFLAVGEDDPIVDPESIEEFYKKMHTHKKLLRIPHAKHEILNESNRRKLYEEVAQWFL